MMDAIIRKREESISRAHQLGYSGGYDTRHGVRLQKGSRHIWYCWKGWQTADKVGGYFINHQVFDELDDAVDRPITEAAGGGA